MPIDDDWMFPPGAPAISPPPYHCTPESKYMYVFYDRPDDVLERAVPAPLQLAPEGSGPRVRTVVGDPVQPPHSHARYHEAILSVKVTFDGQVGWYLPYLWTHNDEAMDAGRLYGWYKQICDDTPIRMEGNTIKGELRRDGDLVYRITFRSTSSPREEEAVAEKLGDLFEGTVYGVKKVPSPEEGGKVLEQVIDTELEDVVMHEIWEGDATVEFSPTAKYPHLHEWEPDQQDIVAAFYARPEFILPYGTVVWDRYE